jgi:hypothetical protein
MTIMQVLSYMLVSVLLCLAWATWFCIIAPARSPLRILPGPPVKGFFGTHMGPILEYVQCYYLGEVLVLTRVRSPARSPKTHEIIIRDYGRAVRIRGLGPVRLTSSRYPRRPRLFVLQWDERLFTLDPAALAHIMKRSDIYEKPWQSRSLITGLIGCGMLAAEGAVHRRQRRVASPAFSPQNLRALVPLVFKKGTQLRDRWVELVDEAGVRAEVEREGKGDGVAEYKGLKMDVAMWISRATFDVIGMAGRRICL